MNVDYDRLRGQKNSIHLMIDILELVVLQLQAHHDGVEQKLDVVPPSWATAQRQHLERYRRLPQDPEVPEPQRRLGAKIDRTLLRMLDVIELAHELARLPHIKKAQQEAREREATRRRRRIERHRRQREAAARRQARPPASTREKRPKHEPKPLCMKCFKRPRTVGRYCGPCAEWEGHG